MHNKFVPELGCSPVTHQIHNKNLLEKLLVICAVAFLLKENDF